MSAINRLSRINLTPSLSQHTQTNLISFDSRVIVSVAFAISDYAATLIAGVAIEVVDPASFPVLSQDFIDAVLCLLSTLRQTQVHGRDGLVAGDSLLELPSTVLPHITFKTIYIKSYLFGTIS